MLVLQDVQVASDAECICALNVWDGEVSEIFEDCQKSTKYVFREHWAPLDRLSISQLRRQVRTCQFQSPDWPGTS